ncbi:MAG TPA: hypothetical protein VND98_00975 [Solirubrobacterales bacterium]|nr:hypothetical protein [Solirubrobacterales bacterium]
MIVATFCLLFLAVPYASATSESNETVSSQDAREAERARIALETGTTLPLPPPVSTAVKNSGPRIYIPSRGGEPLGPASRTSRPRGANAANCGPVKGDTILTDRDGRIYSLPGSEPPETDRIFACLVSGGVVRKLSPLGKSKFRPPMMGAPFVLRAPWVAGLVSEHGRDTLRLAIGARDLRTGAFRSCEVGFGFNGGNKPSVAGIVLKRDGSVAWIGKSRVPGTTQRAPEVGVCSVNGEEAVLDSGEGIDLHSLELHGSTLTWANSGVTHYAVLH